MKDRRRVDELDARDLERLLLVRRREERLAGASGAKPDVGEDHRPPTSAPSRRGKVKRSQLAPLRRSKEAVGPGEPLDGSPTARTGPRAQAAEARRRARASASVGPGKATAEDPTAKPGRSGQVRDKALLAIEITLAVALLGVLIASLRTLGEVNLAASEARRLQTPSPTPLIRVVLLPGGHTPPDAPGGAAPEEVPAHLRDRVGAITPLEMPTPGPEHATRIVISSIGVDAPVVEGDDWEALKQGAGHHVGSANPGERGNCVISAHNDIFGEIFRELPDVSLGDTVTVYTASQAYRYAVTQKRIIEPDEVSVMHPTSSPVLTLISCHPYGIDTHRIVVTAELQP
jgi:sortase A